MNPQSTDRLDDITQLIRRVDDLSKHSAPIHYEPSYEDFYPEGA